MAQPVLPVLSTNARAHHHHQAPRSSYSSTAINTTGPPPVLPRSVRLSSAKEAQDATQSVPQSSTPSGIQASPSAETFWQHQTPFDRPSATTTVGQQSAGTTTVVKILDTPRSGGPTAAVITSVEPSKPTSTTHQLHVSTESQSSSTGFPALSEPRSPPSSLQTSSSYRSPTKWTNFEDEEDSDEVDLDESTGTSHTSPNSSRFAQLDSQDGSSMGLSVPFIAGPGDLGGQGSTTQLSVDLETRNLLEPDAVSEGDNQSLSEAGSSMEVDPYVMSDEQRVYYVENFKQLQRDTLGNVELSGAIRGAEDRVIDFFHKSNLGRDVLSKIWQLADVNQDGWLNLDEFCTAMHLIVLFVKGNVPVPEFLPPHIAPPLTPPRTLPVAEQPGTPGSSGPVGNWQNFDESPEVASLKSNQELVSPSPKNRIFTNLPPQVERPVPLKLSPETEGVVPYQPAPTRPWRVLTGTGGEMGEVFPNGPPPQGAVPPVAQKKASTLPMSPAAPKGPPPKPPPRPPHRHTRSASLDLTRGGIVAKGSEEKKPVTKELSIPHQPDIPDYSGEENLPPLPQLPVKDMETQTEPVELGPSKGREGVRDWPDVGLSRNRYSGAPPMLDLGEEEEEQIQMGAGGAGPRVEPKLSGGEPPELSQHHQQTTLDWKGRCQKLMRLNEELEKERVKLAEHRLFLELELQKLKG